MSVIDEIKSRIDIVDVISDYVTLRKAGRNFCGLCPFHNERNPSFFVFPERQSWHCFGSCSTGGDIFSFIMKKENVDFAEALRILAQRAGVTLESHKVSGEGSRKRDRQIQANEEAALFYHHFLLNSDGGKVAREYLGKRKVSPESINDFRLGFSPDKWESLKPFLLKRGYTERELKECGLIVESDKGTSYDRFRNRLVFPIHDIRGQVIGFGARALDDSLPKYVNSPQSSLFDKGSTFYGIDRARETIRAKNLAIIVEGYMDVIIAHQHDWQNVIASMGTSLTEKQISSLKKLTATVTLALDADAAGEKASLRDIEVLSRSMDRKIMPVPQASGWVKYENILDAEIKVIILPSGKDPDDVIKESPALWQKLVAEALPAMDFIFQNTLTEIDTGHAQGKSLATKNLLPFIHELKDPVRQEYYLQKLAHTLSISEFKIKEMLNDMPANRTEAKRAKGAPGQAHIPQRFLSHPLEEYCLALLFQYPELEKDPLALPAELFESSENRELFLRWQNAHDIALLQEQLDAALAEHLNYLLSKALPPQLENNDQLKRSTMADCILRLQERQWRRLETNKRELLSLESTNDDLLAGVAKLEEQGIESGRQLQKIFTRKKGAA